MLYTVIIDRIDNTNIFNVVYNDQIHNPRLIINESLYSIIDNALIEEYLYELNRIANTSYSLLSQNKVLADKRKFKLSHINLNQKLKQIGYTLFKQFFPETLQDFLKNKNGSSLFFHLTKELASLPIEIMHEGDLFLWEKFSIGKSIKGDYASLQEVVPKDNVNMLIVADPTEDLEWAQKEGEFLFENLSAHFPEKNLNIQLIGGRGVTKLNLLNMIYDIDIIHYCGHLHHSKHPQENGWMLYNEKIIYTSEIKKSGTNPLLIFANSCFSGRKADKDQNSSTWYSQFASSFLHSRKTSYIGTIWQLPDEEPTIEFILHFYEDLLKGMPIGTALQGARKFAKEKFEFNDLTWASYVLMGNPLSRIFSETGHIPDISKNILDHGKVLKEYPYVLAKPFNTFIKTVGQVDKESNLKNIQRSLQALSFLTEQTIYFLMTLLLSHSRDYDLNIRPNIIANDLKKNLDLIFRTLKLIQKKNLQLFIPNLSQVLFHYKKELYKLISFCHIKSSKVEDLQGSLITGQFFIENFFMDIEFLKHYGFYFFVQKDTKQLSLLGLQKYHKLQDIILPAQLDKVSKKEILNASSKMLHKCVFYIPSKKFFLDLSDHIKVHFVKSRSGLKVKAIDFKVQQNYRRPDSNRHGVAPTGF